MWSVDLVSSGWAHRAQRVLKFSVSDPNTTCGSSEVLWAVLTVQCWWGWSQYCLQGFIQREHREAGMISAARYKQEENQCEESGGRTGLQFPKTLLLVEICVPLSPLETVSEPSHRLCLRVCCITTITPCSHITIHFWKNIHRSLRSTSTPTFNPNSSAAFSSSAAAAEQTAAEKESAKVYNRRAQTAMNCDLCVSITQIQYRHFLHITE